MRIRILFSAVFLAAFPAFADQIVLNNGDRLTGTIEKITPDAVVIKPDYAAAITLPRSAVMIVRSDKPVTITDAAGTSHQALVAPKPDNTGWIEVASVAPPVPATTSPAWPAPPASPTASAEPAKLWPPMDLERYYLPVGPHWKNQFTIGLVNTTGNTESTDFSAGLDLHFKDAPHELTLKFSGDAAVTNGAQTSAFALNDNIYRRSLPEWHDDRWYFFLENHNLYDGIKGISLRSTTALGLGYDIFRSERFNADLRAGPGFTYEKTFDGHTTTDAVGIVGARATYKLNNRADLQADALYTEGLTATERYQLTGELALGVKLPEIQRGMGLKFGFRDDYDNTTQSPHKHNDTKLTIGLTLDF